MRAVAIVAVTVLAAPGRADQTPAGSIGLAFGGLSGTGADAKRLGAGYQLGLQASWQPTTTERTVGYSIRWATLFGALYGGTASQIESPLRTVQMDLTFGLRFRPWKAPSRYLTIRAGVGLLRSNEPIPPVMDRSFYGGVASVGFDQYVGGAMFNIDVRYGLIRTDTPTELAVLLGIGFTGP